MSPKIDPIVPGFKVRAHYVLTADEKTKIKELSDIREASESKLRAVQQRILDVERLLNGFFTQKKWDLSWPDGDVVLYDPKGGILQCLEVDHSGHDHKLP
jgi:hypothetical protein